MDNLMNARDTIWAQLDQAWDLIVIGGGITGAGILREATRLGLRTLLVEQRDYAWGTSSRSSKLVHGGLRYLKDRKLGLMWASVRERERLLDDGPGLIDPLGFLIAVYEGDRPGTWTYRAGLSMYDLMALQWTHRRYSPGELRMLAPSIAREGLEGGFGYHDAQTDDARLVLRVIAEAVAAGGAALNYARAAHLLRADDTPDSPVNGIQLHDELSDRWLDLRARVVINATGAWADRLRGEVDAAPRLRPLRGSHMIFPSWRFPIAQAISFAHPTDGRPLVIFPWEGATMVGTTDVDHSESLDIEPRITPQEVAYLMAAVNETFPSLHLGLDDVVSTFAGVRPVVGTGKADPSRESRDHVVWEEEGLLTVTGGKLTTFRLIALDTLEAIRDRLPEVASLPENVSALDAVTVDLSEQITPAAGVDGAPVTVRLDEALRRRLAGRYGAAAPDLIAEARAGELESIGSTATLWAELRWAARHEQVAHLDDLLLRRVRIGLLLPHGGRDILPQVRAVCQAELGWHDARWAAEEARYLDLWQAHYDLPERASIPDWQTPVAKAVTVDTPVSRMSRGWVPLLVVAVVVLLAWWLARRRGAGDRPQRDGQPS